MTMREAAPEFVPNEDHDHIARAIANMVTGTERASGLVLTGIMALCVGLPLLLGVAQGHPFLGMVNALLLGLVGWGLTLLIHALLLNPVSVIRYARAANRLDRVVEAQAAPAALHRSWSDGTPGAITVSHDGRVWLADRSTGYRPITLDRADIRRLEAITQVSVRATRGRRTAVGIGLPIGGGLMATISAEPRPKAPKLRTLHALVMDYASKDDPKIRSTTIPFGADLGGARLMAAVLDYKPV